MVEFGTGYYMPMDREYGHSTPADNSTGDVGLGIKDIGMSVPLGIAASNVQGVDAKMRTGARAFELGFAGAGRSQRGAQTPGVYGKLQRQAMEEIGRLNQVDFTTHSAYSVYGLAGMDQQGNFSKQNKKFAVDEIKRAIDFAADVARGGSVVVHTGEFQRPLSDSEWNQEGKWKGKFKMFEGEEDRATFRVVDDRTGGLIQEARKNRDVARPVWNKYEEGTPEWDEHGGRDYVDEDGNKVRKGEYVDYFGKKLDMAHRVPKFDKNRDRFEIEYLTWEDFRSEANEMAGEAKKFWRKNKGASEKVWRETPWFKFRNAGSEEEINIRPEEAYIIATLQTNAAHSRGWAIAYGGNFDEDVQKVKKLREAKKYYEQMQGALTDDEKEGLKMKAEQLAGGLVPTESKLPTELIDTQITAIQRHMEQAQEASSSQWAQAEEAMETARHVMSAEEYALAESYDSYAQAGMTAMMQSDRLEKEGKLKKPLFISMENIFPENYGAHPDELNNLIEGSRKSMAKMLTQKGYSESEASKEASEHIKATLDTGHLNLWRKYWQGDTNKSIEENDKDFDNWMVEKVEMLAKKGMIGNVHAVDNYGYQDDHLSPGEGNAPMKRFMEVLKKHGYKDAITVEPGADASTDLSDFHGLMKTWRLFGSSIYGIGAGAAPVKSGRWGDVQQDYFGKVEPPYFVFGQYSPAMEEWRMWSGVPLE